METAEGEKLSENEKKRKEVKEEMDFLEEEHKKKKPEEISQVERMTLKNSEKIFRRLKMQGKPFLKTSVRTTVWLNNLLI